MMLYTFSGTAVLLGLAGLCLLLALTVVSLRRILRQQATGQRTKNAAFSFTGPVQQLSLCAAIAAAFVTINWTRFAAEPTQYAAFEVIEDLIEVDIPTFYAPPPPPPPPPPVIETAPVIEVEPEEFVSLDVAADEAVPPPAPPPALAPAAAPVPPPPPPPVDYGTDQEFLFVERMPVFGQECRELSGDARKACSDRALLAFVQSRVRYPAMARENGLQGTVVVSFTVEKDGSISAIEAVRKIAGGCTEEALKAVEAINREGQKFTPGMQQGRPVRVRFNLPIKFTLQ
ncbi:energy transducer TonB [Neolewinella lacunae]|uniref:Energy transducer TonB n=1 Tax=Neolewinella lacunae TaxID=1517758 RepID=A0A923T9K1_9BACT|nr:energy transducer TonB [Neolewinella lacunae]MBC6996805.1 energy transducer TonB [Neolewinella lacunae]MDN3637033.1 energy transducer TonB [Neolewinella lacunae]